MCREGAAGAASCQLTARASRHLNSGRTAGLALACGAAGSAGWAAVRPHDPDSLWRAPLHLGLTAALSAAAAQLPEAVRRFVPPNVGCAIALLGILHASSAGQGVLSPLPAQLLLVAEPFSPPNPLPPLERTFRAACTTNTTAPPLTAHTGGRPRRGRLPARRRLLPRRRGHRSDGCGTARDGDARTVRAHAQRSAPRAVAAASRACPPRRAGAPLRHGLL